MLRAGAVLVGVVLLLGLSFVGAHLVDWHFVDLRTTAGSVFSPPMVDAKLHRKVSYGFLVGWQRRYTLEVKVGAQQYRSNGLPDDVDEIQVSPNRRTIALHSGFENQWWLYRLGPQDPGNSFNDGAIGIDDERYARAATLTWASTDLTPVPTDWWLVRLAAVSGTGALAVLVLLVRHLRARRS